MKFIKKFPFLFVLLVLVPGFLGTWYYLEIASDQFETEAHFIIQGNEKPNNDMLSALTGIPSNGGSAKDALVIRDFILSKAFLKRIDKDLKIREHFSADYIDEYSRIPSEYSQEEFHEYWLEFVDIQHEDIAQISKLYVTAFDPAMSVEIAEYILKESETLIDQLSERAQKDTLAFSEKELVKAKVNLANARKAMLSLRNESQSVDLEKTAELKTGLVSGLEAELAKQEAELTRLQAYMQPTSVQVRAQIRQLNALKQQINRERQRWSSTQQRKPNVNQRRNTKALNEQIALYEELVVEKTFAEKVYEAALIANEKARIEAQQKHRYLINIVQPQLPDAATKPDRYWEVAKLWIGCFLFWGIFSLMLSSIRDHAGFA